MTQETKKVAGLTQQKFLMLAILFMAIAFVVSMGQNVIRYGHHASYRPLRSVLYLSTSLLLFIPLLPAILRVAKTKLATKIGSYGVGATALVVISLVVFYGYSSLFMYLLGFYDEPISAEYARSYLGREAFLHILVMVGALVFAWHLKQVSEPEKMITGAQGRKKVTLPANTIHWIEADDHYLKLFGDNITLLKRATLTQMAEELKPEFIRIHRKYLVNTRRIVGHEKQNRAQYVILSTGDKLKVGKSYSHLLENGSVHDK